MKLIPCLVFILMMSTTARCEKVYRTLGMYSTQSPNQKFRALLDTASKAIEIMKMSDSSIIGNLEGCAGSRENLPSWENDSIISFFDVRGDSISLYTYELNDKALIGYGKQCQCNQNFSRTLVLLENRHEFSIDKLKVKYRNHLSLKSCD
jgi:hypothetical protein